MEYEYIPQRIYKIDGIPARTYGEWPGKHSNHWDGSIKIIHCKPHEKIFEESTAPILGRRHFSAAPSKEDSRFRGKKTFPGKKDLENIEERKTGIKFIPEPKRPETNFTNRRHYPPRFGKEIIPSPYYIRTFHPDGNCRTFKEILLQKEFGEKRKIWTLAEKRNFLELRNPGDKCYKMSEQATGFFKEGGLIPGSSNINYPKTQSLKSNNFYETLDLNTKTLKDEKKWKNKIKAEALENDQKYVKTLGIWEDKILSDYVAKDKEKEEKNKIEEQKNQKGGKKGAVDNKKGGAKKPAASLPKGKKK